MASATHPERVDWAKLVPKLDPEAVRGFLAADQATLTSVESQLRFVLRMHLVPSACPMCFFAVDVFAAGDDTQTIGGGYRGKYFCPSCGTELVKVIPLVMMPGTGGWHWRRAHPVPAYYVPEGTDLRHLAFDVALRALSLLDGPGATIEELEGGAFRVQLQVWRDLDDEDQLPRVWTTVRTVIDLALVSQHGPKAMNEAVRELVNQATAVRSQSEG